MSAFTNLPRELVINGNKKRLGMKFSTSGYIVEYFDEKDYAVFMHGIGGDKEEACAKLYNELIERNLLEKS